VPVDPSAPLTAVAFYPSKDRTEACADASVSIEFNRTPVINGGGAIQIHDAASGAVFDSVTANPRDGLYYSDLVARTSGGASFQSDALDIVFNTVVFQPKGKLEYGKTYYVTVDEGMISDAMGTAFSVAESDGWSFTVRQAAPAASGTYTLAADGSGDYCSVEGVLQALPDSSSTPRVVTVAKGVYPGIVRMNDSNVHFQGAGIDQSVFSNKNSATMNSSREGMVVSGSDVTFENLTIFNTYLEDGSGQQAEALYVSSSSQRVFLDNVHLRSQQDTLRVDGDSVYMLGGKISGSTDPLWGYGAFYCDGCELSSRSSGHAFVVARSTQGFALVNCSVTKDNPQVSSTSLAQYHDGSEPGKIAFVRCKIDDHIEGWRRPENNDWYEYDNTDMDGNPVTFNGTQLSADSPVLDQLSSPQNWLGWSP
jgi:pectin methylesterase-like acyl-CoA thioesterase